jgi:hypothetical protein
VDAAGGTKRWACVGELHFDLSEAGAEAYAKAKTAVHYNTEFPGLDKDYIGLSVNAYGDAEPRDMMIDGTTMEVNYVKKFVQAASCDMVTVAGRGGKILALVESVAGAGGQNQEVRSMIIKKLDEARRALTSAKEAKDWEKVSESLKLIEALSSELVKAGATAKPSKEGDKPKGKDAKDDKDADDMTAEEREAYEKKEKEKKEKKEADARAAESAAAAHAPDPEAHALSVKALITEAGLKEDRFDMPEVLAMTFQEAKKHVAMVKRLCGTITKDVIESIGADLRIGHPGKISEAGKDGSKDNASFFADCAG